MKIIITERQNKMLLKSNTESMQSLIDMAFNDLKEECENSWADKTTCEEVEAIEKIKVTDVQKVFTKTTEQNYFLLVKIDVDYNYNKEYLDLSNIELQLQWATKQIVGNIIRVLINNQNNTRKQFD